MHNTAGKLHATVTIGISSCCTQRKSLPQAPLEDNTLHGFSRPQRRAAVSVRAAAAGTSSADTQSGDMVQPNTTLGPMLSPSAVNKSWVCPGFPTAYQTQELMHPPMAGFEEEVLNLAWNRDP